MKCKVILLHRLKRKSLGAFKNMLTSTSYLNLRNENLMITLTELGRRIVRHELFTDASRVIAVLF